MTNLPPPPAPDGAPKPVVMRFTVNGANYSFRVPLLAREERDLHQETGHRLAGLFPQLQSDPGLDIVAAFIWIARRQRGEQTVTFDAVLDQLDAAGPGNVTFAVTAEDPVPEPHGQN